MTTAADPFGERDHSREMTMGSEQILRDPPAAKDRGFLQMEDPARFQHGVVQALWAGGAAALLVWMVWAIAALAMTHLPGTWLGSAGAWVAGPVRSGVILGGGAGLGAGAVPLLPVVTIFLAMLAARGWLGAIRDGKVAVAPSLSRAAASLAAPQAELPDPASGVRVAARVVPVIPAATWIYCGAAGIVAGALPWLLPTRPAFGLFVGGLILGFILTRRSVPGTRPRARRLAVLGCGFTTLVGVATVEAIASHGWVEAYLPGPLPLILYGAGLGGFLVLGCAVAHLSAPTDPVKAHFRDTCQNLQGELKEVATRAHDTYRSTAAILIARAGDRAEALRLRDRLASVTHRVLDLAAQCQAVSAAVGEETELQLAREISGLDRKIDAASDEVARGYYERARSTLATQQEQLDRIRVGRDRAVATMYSQLALLERARLSLIGVQSSDTTRLMTELAVLSESLDGASAAMDAETEAMLAVSV